jgi:hypothetical protein
MHFKRRKSRRSVRCTLCTPHRWHGNAKDRFKAKDEAERERARRECIREIE